MTAPYNFGLSQEDERTEADALQLEPTDRVLCVASAGEMPLSLLAMGTQRVVAADVNEAQLHLLALKLAAIRTLGRIEALRLLGYLPSERADRSRAFAEVSHRLPGPAREFWSTQAAAITRGAIWAGRYERYVRLLVRLIAPLVGRARLDRLFLFTSIDEQRDYFDHAIGRPIVRGFFRFAFHPRVYAKRGMDPRGLAHLAHLAHCAGGESLGMRYYQQFRQMCTSTLASDNHLLQLTLLGRVVSPAAVPFCFSDKGVTALRAHGNRLELCVGDISTALRQHAPGAFSKIQLSNIGDWETQAYFDEVLALIADRVSPGRAVWRFIHVEREVPAELRARIRVDRDFGARLRAADRFPFYGIAPAVIQ